MENRKRGRPPLPPQDRRDGAAWVRMTDQERAAVEARAAAHGLTLSEFFRRRALSQPMPKAGARDQETAELTTALLRLGVNLNQIAKHMNAGRNAPPDLPLLIAEIAGHVDRLTDEPGRDRKGPEL